MPRKGGSAKAIYKKIGGISESQDIIKSLFGDSSDPEVFEKNAHIIYPKYIIYRDNIKKIIELLKIISRRNVESASLLDQFQISEYDNVVKYIAELNEKYQEYFSEKYYLPEIAAQMTTQDEYMLLLQKQPPNYIKDFAVMYQKFKKSVLLDDIIQCGAYITMYHTVLTSKELSLGKIKRIPSLKPFSKLNINFADWIRRCDNKDVGEMIVKIILKLHSICIEVYNNRRSPDSDPEMFKCFMESIIKDIKKRIPGCDEAFRIILDSMDLLKTNYKSYYENFTMTSNPSVVLESYIQDLTKMENRSPTIVSQFHKIIQHYRGMITKMKQSGKVNKGDDMMENILEKNMKIIEEHLTDGKSKNKDEDEDEDDEDEEVSGINCD